MKKILLLTLTLTGSALLWSADDSQPAAKRPKNFRYLELEAAKHYQIERIIREIKLDQSAADVLELFSHEQLERLLVIIDEQHDKHPYIHFAVQMSHIDYLKKLLEHQPQQPAPAQDLQVEPQASPAFFIGHVDNITINQTSLADAQDLEIERRPYRKDTGFFRCAYRCGYKNKDANKVRLHEFNVHRAQFRCDVCRRYRGVDKDSLRKHYFNRHPELKLPSDAVLEQARMAKFK